MTFPLTILRFAIQTPTWASEPEPELCAVSHKVLWHNLKEGVVCCCPSDEGRRDSSAQHTLQQVLALHWHNLNSMFDSEQQPYEQDSCYQPCGCSQHPSENRGTP